MRKVAYQDVSKSRLPLQLYALIVLGERKTEQFRAHPVIAAKTETTGWDCLSALADQGYIKKDTRIKPAIYSPNLDLIEKRILYLAFGMPHYQEKYAPQTFARIESKKRQILALAEKLKRLTRHPEKIQAQIQEELRGIENDETLKANIIDEAEKNTPSVFKKAVEHYSALLDGLENETSAKLFDGREALINQVSIHPDHFVFSFFVVFCENKELFKTVPATEAEKNELEGIRQKINADLTQLLSQARLIRSDKRLFFLSGVFDKLAFI